MDMGSGDPDNVNASRSACTECQRRKQKCNREWPCNHCQKRKVADKCRFNQAAPSTDKSASGIVKKRGRNQEKESDQSDSEAEDEGDGFEALGYMHPHFFANLPDQNDRKPKPTPRQHFVTASACPQLQRALQILPPRTTTDALVQNFLTRANFHYYIIYPPSFLQEYRDWWADRFAHRPLGLQWTCLLLNICACSAQYSDLDLQQKVETELGESIDILGDQYHNAARELHSVVPVGLNHILSVQQLLHSSYWYKSEARFVESWHVLNSAIREAQELGIHREKTTGPISEFDREMRRRVWCVLDTWDWQISALLSRPRIIDRSDCDVAQPTLTLEGYSPSPLLHMKLQSQLIGQLSTRFGVPKNANSPAQVQEYINTIESWIKTLPAPYSMDRPDTSQDSRHTWIMLHRFYLHAMTYSMMMDPIRPYLARRMTKHSPKDEQIIRQQGVDYTLKLMEKLRVFFEHVYPHDAKFHFVLFSIFDTAAVICSALMHDEDQSLFRRQDMIRSMEDAISMLKRLINVTKTAKTSYEVLVRLSTRVKSSSGGAKKSTKAKRARHANSAISPPSAPNTIDGSLSSSDVGSTDGFELFPESPNEVPNSHQPIIAEASPNYSSYSDSTAVYSNHSAAASTADSNEMLSAHGRNKLSPETGVIMAAPHHHTYIPPNLQEGYQNFTMEPFSAAQLGELASMWNYQSLDLNFSPSNPQ